MEGYVEVLVVRDEKVILLLGWEYGVFREVVIGRSFWLEFGVYGVWNEVDGVGENGLVKSN